MTTTEPRYRVPEQATDRGDDMAFRAWVKDDRDRYVCAAAFRYLQEALDFIGYCHARECDVWFQSPFGVEEKKAPVRPEPANAG